MIKRGITTGLAAAALLLTGCLTAVAATPAAAAEPAGREQSVEALDQECIYRVLAATLIEFDGGGSTWLQPEMEVHGPNDLGPINVYSYAHQRRGWVYRTYENLRIVGCDP